MQIALTIIGGSFSIHRLASDAGIPTDILSEPFFAVLRSTEELCLAFGLSVDGPRSRRKRAQAGLVLVSRVRSRTSHDRAAISAVLSSASVPVFVVSSFDTDYVLVRSDDLDLAVAALRGWWNRM